MKTLLGISIIVYLIISLIITASACETAPIPSYLTVQVIDEPAGGTNISSLACTYQVTYTYTGYQNGKSWYVNEAGEQMMNAKTAPEPVTLTVEWIDDEGNKYNEEQLVFSTAEDAKQSGTYTTTWENPPSGRVFDKTYRVRFSWNDNDVNYERESNKAVCTVR
jgi:hypothetical protein